MIYDIKRAIEAVKNNQEVTQSKPRVVESIPESEQKVKSIDELKVNAQPLDQLIDMIDELIIAEAVINQSEELKHPELKSLRLHLSKLNIITRELQRINMSLIVVPIKEIF